MARGLIPPGAEEQPVPGDPPMQGDDSPEGDGNVMPEEQEAYAAFMVNVANVLFDEKSLNGIVERLSSGEPVPAVAQTAAMVVMRVEDSAEESTQTQVDPDILLNAGKETVEILAEMSEKAGIHSFTEEELEAAYLAAVDQYRQTREKQGKIQPSQFQQEMAELKQSDDDGTLDQKYPQIAQYAEHVKKRGAAGGQPPQQVEPEPGA